MKITTIKILIFFSSLLITPSFATPIATFDIGSNNWVSGIPNTFSSTVAGLSITATANKVILGSLPLISAFSGNDNPAILRNFTYTLPQIPNNANTCFASIDFFHLSLNTNGLPEGIGNFTPPPNSMTLSPTHSYTANTLEGSGSHAPNGANISTLRWNLSNIPSTVSFDIAANNNVAFVGHKNLIIDCEIPPEPVPTLNEWMLILLSGMLLLIGITPKALKQAKNKDT